jgi:hypothetical protein
MSEIDLNQAYAGQLGWTPADLGGADFDAGLVAIIRGLQGALGVGVDGVCGPTTYRAWIERALTALAAPRAGADRLRDAGLIALYTAKRAWLDEIIDPPDASPAYAASRAAIDAMIRTPDGLDWSWSTPYVHDGDYQWCGAFASFAWRAAGVARSWRYTFFSSTFRLDAWARYQPFQHEANARPATGPYRRLCELDERSRPEDAAFGPGDGPRAGDILLVGGEHPAYGQHVTIVESYDATAGVFTTIEGNGTGAWPSGRRVQGVVRASRPVGVGPGEPPTRYHAHRLIRPALADLA